MRPKRKQRPTQIHWWVDIFFYVPIDKGITTWQPVAEIGSSIASLLKVDDSQTKELAEIALEQMAERKEGKKHTLKTISKARKVMVILVN